MSTQKEIEAADVAEPYSTEQLMRSNFVVPWETARLIATTRVVDALRARVVELEAQLKAATTVN